MEYTDSDNGDRSVVCALSGFTPAFGRAVCAFGGADAGLKARLYLRSNSNGKRGLGRDFHPTLCDTTAKDGAPGRLGLGGENNRNDNSIDNDKNNSNGKRNGKNNGKSRFLRFAAE